MMKKNGFTLAEVLITLSIIGVIATLTLPTLMTNINESQNKTGFKKVINTLSKIWESCEKLLDVDGNPYKEYLLSFDNEKGSIYEFTQKVF